MSDVPPVDPPALKARVLKALDLAIRVSGGVIAAVLGAGSALLQATATPLHAAIPITAAIVGNAFLVWFAQSTVDRSWAWVIPAVPWFAVFVAAISPTGDGDLLANSMTGLVTFGAGAATFFVAIAFRPGDGGGRSGRLRRAQ